MDLPSVPKGALGVLVVSSSLSIVLLIVGAVRALREHGRTVLGWALAPLLIVAVTIVAARTSPTLHLLSALLLVGLVGRNAVVMRAWTYGIGGVAWILGMILAKSLFGGG